MDFGNFRKIEKILKKLRAFGWLVCYVQNSGPSKNPARTAPP